MAFRLVSWNVEHFKSGDAARLDRVVGHLEAQKPDVFGLLEMEGANVRQLMEFALRSTTSSSPTARRCRRSSSPASAASSTRRPSRRSASSRKGNPSLRPGALLSVRQAATWTNMLFLRTDSGTTAGDFGNRSDMFEKLWKVAAKLDQKLNGDPRFLPIGDLNTMGMAFPTTRKAEKRVTAAEEIAALSRAAKKVGMTLLAKDHATTWSNGKMTSDLDHIVASDGLGIALPVKVRGWQQLEGAARRQFIDQTSDHCSLTVDVP